ncbi:hypothetical protein VNI00_005955 [Paramarasmius palmivorus]|uniref:Uncharacterized protein n=1 Tax=Paramarasmius palmivorus TaxID=297713 RepID=A0AAW0DCW0_9AGAR
MTSKTLSTGTLSLRFMQNARNKQAQGVQLEKANVEDDGQWEISKEIRDSWGVKAESNKSIDHDSSYLPFLFPSLPDPDASKTVASASSSAPTSTEDYLKPKGRRTFRKGQEVLEQVEDPKPAEDQAEGSESKTDADTRPDKMKKTASRLTMLSKAISEKSTSAGILKPGKAIAASLPSARLAIFESSEASSGSAPKAFMKPADVDDPNEHHIVDGARAKKKRTSDPDQQENPGPKRKKKKKAVE